VVDHITTDEVIIAPRAGAWIEIHPLSFFLNTVVSHLVQVRGLKSADQIALGEYKLSHLVQVRGLKSLVWCRLRHPYTSHLVQVRGLKFR